MAYAKEMIFKMQYLHILDGEKNVKWPFFSVQQFCRYCSLEMYGNMVFISL